MISKGIGGKTKKIWELCPEQLTLEQALEILNPDSRECIGNKRGAFKRVVSEFQKEEPIEMDLENAKDKISVFENKLNLPINIFQEILDGKSIKVTIADEEVICRNYEVDLKNRCIKIAFYHPNLTSYRTYDFKNYGKDWFIHDEK